MEMYCVSCGAPLVDDDKSYCECEYCGTLNPNHARRARIQEQIDMARATNSKYNIQFGSGHSVAIGDGATIYQFAIGNDIIQR